MTDSGRYQGRARSVLIAAAWLTNSQDQSDREVLLKARLTGLLPVGLANWWKCDGAILTRKIERRLRSSQTPINGAILVGVGEMMAHSHASKSAVENLFRRLFTRSTPPFVRVRILREALDFMGMINPPSRSESLSVYQATELSIFNWKELDVAESWISHPAPVGLFVGYGPAFIMRMMLRYNLAGLKWFVGEAAKHNLLPAIVAAVGEACFWSDRMAQRALMSGIPFFVGFGVAKLRNGGEDGQGWTASDIDAALFKGGTSKEGRTYVSARMLKEAVHAWHRQKDRPSQNRHRKALLRVEPQLAVGGEEYAKNEIEHLEANEPDLANRKHAVVVALTDALRTAASHNFNPKALADIFEPSLVDTPEIRHLFAMEHLEGYRQAALEVSVATFDKLIGVRNPNAEGAERFDQHRAEGDVAYWAAMSQVELSKAKNSNTGHDAARRIAKTEKALQHFILLPFASARFTSRFQNELSRWSVVLQFAFYVSLIDQNSPLVVLRDHALESAALFLPVADRYAFDPKWGDNVAGLVADTLASMEASQARNWIGNEQQPLLVRASTLWARPDLIAEDPERAADLAERTANRKVRFYSAGRTATNLLRLLDRSAAAMLVEKRSDLYEHLAVPYAAAFAQGDAPLARSIGIKTIQDALGGDTTACAELISDPVWSDSRLAKALQQLTPAFRSTSQSAQVRV